MYRTIITNTEQKSIYNQWMHSFNYAKNLALIKNKSVILCPIAASNYQTGCGTDWNLGLKIMVNDIIHYSSPGPKYGRLVVNFGSINFIIFNKESYTTVKGTIRYVPLDSNIKTIKYLSIYSNEISIRANNFTNKL